MNKNRQRNCMPRKKGKKKCSCQNIGIAMLILGTLTVLAIFLPMRCWVMLLSIALIIFGFMLLRK